MKLFTGFISFWMSFLQPETDWNHFRSGRQEFTTQRGPLLRQNLWSLITSLHSLLWRSLHLSLSVFLLFFFSSGFTQAFFSSLTFLINNDFWGARVAMAGSGTFSQVVHSSKAGGKPVRDHVLVAGPVTFVVVTEDLWVIVWIIILKLDWFWNWVQCAKDLNLPKYQCVFVRLYEFVNECVCACWSPVLWGHTMPLGIGLCIFVCACLCECMYVCVRAAV